MVDLRRTQIPPAKTVEGRDTKIHLRQHYSRLRMKKWIHCNDRSGKASDGKKKGSGEHAPIAVILRAIA